MSRKHLFFSIVFSMLAICIFWLVSFFAISGNTKKISNVNIFNEASRGRSSNTLLVNELITNFNNYDNNLYLNIDISDSLNYENDYYNYDKKPTEHLKLNPYTKSSAIFNIQNLKNIYLISQNNFSIDDAYSILLNANTIMEIKASSYKVQLKNTLYESGATSITQNNLVWNLELELLNSKFIDIDYCKILKVDLSGILLNAIKNSIHYNYKYFNPNNNAYPSAILYFKTFLNEKIKMVLNKPKSIYFVYDFNFEKLLTFQTTNLSNDLNDISIKLPTIMLNFCWEKLLIIKKLNDEYISNINTSDNFYNYFLWAKLIPLFFINNTITASLTNDANNTTIILWKNNDFISNNLIVKNSSNKQINILNNFKELNNGFSFDTKKIFANSFSTNDSIFYDNNQIIFNFMCRTTFLRIENFLELKDALIFNSNKYASELVDEYKNIYNKKNILDFLNSQIRIIEGVLFSEVLTFNDINFDNFTNFENDIKKWNIKIFNNNYCLPTYNENGYIFFLAKIKNWKFYNDQESDIFQGDYSKTFKEMLINHDNFIYLNQKEHFSNDGYFIVKIQTNKITSIIDTNDSNILWKLNSVENFSKIKKHFSNSLNYSTKVINNSDFVFTYQMQSTSINTNSNINMKLDKPIALNYFHFNKNNFGNPINNIMAMVYNLPLNKFVSDKNKIILKSNNKYYLNNLYKLDIKPLIDNEFQIRISNKTNNEFDFNISLGEMLNLLYDSLNEHELNLINFITGEYTKTNKFINWYFILFIISILMLLITLIFITYKKIRHMINKSNP